MSNVIYGNMVGGGSAPLKTLILEDESGNTITGVVVGSEVIFTATDNDVREGMVYASDDGVSIGNKHIPAYITSQGFQIIDPDTSFTISLPTRNMYDYTQLQCLIAPFNTSIDDSYAVDKVVIDDCVYMAGSADKIADVTKNSITKSIDLNITNTTSNIYFIYFFTYKEEV